MDFKSVFEEMFASIVNHTVKLVLDALDKEAVVPVVVRTDSWSLFAHDWNHEDGRRAVFIEESFCISVDGQTERFTMDLDSGAEVLAWARYKQEVLAWALRRDFDAHMIEVDGMVYCGEWRAQNGDIWCHRCGARETPVKDGMCQTCVSDLEERDAEIRAEFDGDEDNETRF